LIPFVTAGYPEKETFVATVAAISAVGDVVEIGVPFSDPMADGMTIQRSSHGYSNSSIWQRAIFLPRWC
jgi:tryptophan synthase alpha chain